MIELIDKAKCEVSEVVYKILLLVLKTGLVFIWEGSGSEK